MDSNKQTCSHLFDARGINVCLGGRRVVHEVDLALRSGELFGIVGANGSGKSTLLRGVLGFVPCESGEVRFRGEDFSSYSGRERAREIGYLPQDAECGWPIAAERVVMLGRLPFLAPWGGPAEEDVRSVASAMASVDVAGLARRPVTQLSGGERLRVLLARALAGNPALLFADEPSSGLDPYHQLQLMELFRGHVHANGATVVVVLHNLALASRFCDRLLLLNEGRTVACGPPGEVLQPGHLQSAYGIEAKILESGGQRAVIPWRRVEK